MTSNQRLDGCIALITGASRGIGRTLALALAREGAEIIALARTVGALEELDDEISALGSKATLVPLDIRDFDAIDRLGADIAKRWKRLDILIGNAGVLGPVSPVPHISPENWQEVIDVNLTANYRLIRSMDPLLRASDAGRAVFISSGVAKNALPFFGGYATSKAALAMLVRTYALECEKTRLKVNLLNPGPMRTKMRAAAFPGERPETVPAPDKLVPLLMKLVDPDLQETGQTFDFKS